MRNSILRDLFNGKHIPWERREHHTGEFLCIVKKIEEAEGYFTQKMSLDDCKKFKELQKLYSDLSYIEQENLFAYAFSLGFMLAQDIIRESELIFNEENA